MDQRRFDDLTRLLGASGTRRGGLRAALGGLLGLGAGAAAADAKDARRGTGRNHGPAAGRKRRHECGPDAPCPTGYDCVKQGRKRRCSCASAVLCDGACCAAGEICQDGACVAPGACVPPGEPCKGVGLPCCDGRTCASGQGGMDDIACYVHKTGACTSTADCVYGTACIDGRCAFDVPPPAALGAACNASVGQLCADPDATCAAYDGPDAPDGEPGTYCTLPLNKVCTGDPDCTCYHCWYENPAVGGATRAGQTRAVSTRLACCGPAGYTCKTDRNCCLGTLCVNGACQSETTCDVCQDGSCPYSSIKAAYDAMPAGSTIRIAPGDYREARVILSKDVTFRRCGDSGKVVWSNGTSNMLLGWPPSGPRASRVDLAFIEFTWNSPGPEYLMDLGGSAGPRLQLTALGCTFRDYVYPSYGYSAVSLRSYIDADFTDCTFTNLRIKPLNNGAAIISSGDASAPNTVSLTRCAFTGNSGGNGGAIHLKITSLTAIDSTFTDNTAAGAGGAIYTDRGSNREGSSISLHNCTLSGNTSQTNGRYGGGGAVLACHTCTVSVSGTTRITGNTATIYGSGIRAEVWDPASYAVGRITGTTSANVSGNVSAPDCQVYDSYDASKSFAVTCDGWCVPSGGACDVTYTTCCTGSCNAGACT